MWSISRGEETTKYRQIHPDPPKLKQPTRALLFWINKGRRRDFGHSKLPGSRAYNRLIMKSFQVPNKRKNLYPGRHYLPYTVIYTPYRHLKTSRILNLPNPGTTTIPGFSSNPRNPTATNSFWIVSKQNPRSKHKPYKNYAYRYIYSTKNTQSKTQTFKTHTPIRNTQNHPKSNHFSNLWTKHTTNRHTIHTRHTKLFTPQSTHQKQAFRKRNSCKQQQQDMKQKRHTKSGGGTYRDWRRSRKSDDNDLRDSSETFLSSGSKGTKKKNYGRREEKLKVKIWKRRVRG